MTQQVINVGTVANDGTGDPLRTAFIKVNANFAELYTLVPKDVSGNPIPAAPINSPVFTGDPQAPTALPGDNDTSIATTQFVTAAVAAGTAGFAPINSPLFTGDPRAPTPADGDSDTSIPTTAWVKRNFATINPITPPPAGPDLSAYAPLASPIFTGDPRSNATLALNDNDTSLATTAWVTSVLGGLGGGGGGGGPVSTVLGFGPPHGRLTLQSQTPVMITSVTGATQIFYSPYIGNRVPIWDGTNFAMTTFTELVGSTVDTLKNPGPCGPDLTHDWYVWNDMTVPATPVLRLTHGVAWGAPPTEGVRPTAGEIERVNGLWVNKVDIPNGPTARKGTYVGTTHTDMASHLQFVLGSLALGGGAAYLDVWNTYNRVACATAVVDTTASWSVPAWNGTPPPFHMLNQSANNRVSYIAGLAEDAFIGAIYQGVVMTAGGEVAVGLGFDSTTLYSGPIGWVTGTGINSTIGAGNVFGARVGRHFVQSLEYAGTAGNSFWGKVAVSGVTVNGMQVTIRV